MRGYLSGSIRHRLWEMTSTCECAFRLSAVNTSAGIRSRSGLDRESSRSVNAWCVSSYRLHEVSRACTATHPELQVAPQHVDSVTASDAEASCLRFVDSTDIGRRVGELLQDRRAFNGENFRDTSVDPTRVSHANGVGLTLRQSPGRSGSGAQVASRWAQQCDSGRVGRDIGSKVENRDAEQTMRGTRILSVERPSTGKRQTD